MVIRYKGLWISECCHSYVITWCHSSLQHEWKWMLNMFGYTQDCAISIGNFNDNLVYEDGQLILKYVSGNGKCQQRHNYTTTILFTCHHNKRGTEGPQYLPHRSTECSHWFEWPTSHACLPFRFDSCYLSVNSTVRWYNWLYICFGVDIPLSSLW